MNLDYHSKYKDLIENNITLPYQLEEYRKMQKAKVLNSRIRKLKRLKKCSNNKTVSNVP